MATKIQEVVIVFVKLSDGDFGEYEEHEKSSIWKRESQLSCSSRVSTTATGLVMDGASCTGTGRMHGRYSISCCQSSATLSRVLVHM
jgi:hypothetical protein